MPAKQKVTRKLTAIMSADVKGYSILMADDEVATIQTLKVYRNIMSTCIEQYGGRVVDAVGDNLLAEFGSAVDAVQCAVEVQRELDDKNEEIPDDRKLQFRIGVNIGDVIQDGDRIFGDGVNIAARIEGLADAGGICISRSTYDQIKRKLDLSFEYLGEHDVKNIKESVRVYRILMDSGSPTPIVEEKLELPDKPSIAVLPFDNMSGEPSQEYFSDGLTEQIINGLCKASKLFVIARNSSFAYKGKAVSIKQIADELGVKYILEGSVQRAADRVRITAQLIDAKTDYHMWSEKFDRDLEDIFALQDEITLKVVVALQVELTEGEQARVRCRSTKNIDAWALWVKAYDLFEQHTKEDNAKARDLLDDAIKIDPNYATAYALKAVTYFQDVYLGYASSPAESFIQSVELCQKALSLDNTAPDSLALWGMIQVIQKNYDEAVKYGEKAVELGPNNAEAHALFGVILIYTGRVLEAIGLLKKAMRFQPDYHAWYSLYLGMAYTIAQEYSLALSAFDDVIARAPHQTWGFSWSAVVYMRLDQKEKARLQIKKALELNPELTVGSFSEASNFYKNPKIREGFIKNLREAGLPE
jgi:adenylate cyclase